MLVMLPGKELIDYIADYLENIRERRVFPDVKPGFIRSMIPPHPPLEPESWNSIMDDIENVIMPGVSVVLFLLKIMGFSFSFFLQFYHLLIFLLR